MKPGPDRTGKNETRTAQQVRNERMRRPPFEIFLFWLRIRRIRPPKIAFFVIGYNSFYEKRRIRSLSPDTLTRFAGYAHVQSERIRHMRNGRIRSVSRRIRSLHAGYAHLAPDTLTVSLYSTPAGYAHFQKTYFAQNLYLSFLVF